MLISSEGEDKVFICKKCKFAANIEKTGEIKNCPKCRARLEKMTCIELGHIFNLGTKYSEIIGAEYLDKKGKKHPVVMGCYGIGPTRLMAAVVEIHNDEKGIIWPEEIAPFQIHLIQIERTKKISKTAEKIYQDLSKAGIKVLYDDREKSPGEKFADSDLIGIPLRLVVSERTIKRNSVEIKKRGESKIKLVKIKNLLQFLKP